MAQLDPPKLTLVKELESDTLRVILQFYDAEGQAVGPSFANKALALEWYVEANAALYVRPERRQSHIDRRLHENSGQRAEKRAPSGRRHTDREPDFIDNVAKLRQEIKQLLLSKAEYSQTEEF